MPAPHQVSLYKRDGSFVTYATYSDARNDAKETDLIQILADLNEQIVLLNGVDIWIMPGVVISRSNYEPVIIDNSEEYKEPVTCNIYGEGVIKNTNSTSGNCIVIVNEGSSVTINCEQIECEYGPSVQIYPSKKFHLTCNNVISKKYQAISIGDFNTPGIVEDVNLNISRIETGDINNFNTGTTALTTRCNGFIKVDEIVCRNNGHCLLHQEGTVIARIKKMSSKMNSSYNVSTVYVAQSFSSGTQKLILYFDEILNLVGEHGSALSGIIVNEGTGIFLGRRVYSDWSPAVQIGGTSTNGFVKIDEIISNNGAAMVLNDFANQITVDVNYIEGYGDGGIVYSAGAANFRLKNSKIKNKLITTSVAPVGVFIFGGQQIINIENIKIVVDNPTSGHSIFTNATATSIKNYGLYVNKEINSSQLVTLEIGTAINYLYTVSSDLT